MRFSARNLDPAAANAIHDDAVAQQFGFAGALVPGVELWGCTAAALVEHWGPGWLSGGRLALRFRRPVYDGEQVEVDLAADGALSLRGPDGGPRAVGSAAAAGALAPIDLAAWPSTPLPASLPPAAPASLPVGPLGTVVEPVGAARDAQYREQLGGSSPDGAVHPGLLLRAVNLLLMRNVALGPWIHTASDARLLAPAPVEATLEVRGAVRGTSVRSGHDEVRYDALVLADGLPVLHVEHTALFRLAVPG